MDWSSMEESVNTIEVLIPTAEARAKQIRMAERPADLDGKTVGFIWNRKPNGDLLLNHLEKFLKERYSLRDTLMRKKSLASSGASHELLEELSAKCDLVILAIGD